MFYWGSPWVENKNQGGVEIREKCVGVCIVFTPLERRYKHQNKEVIGQL